MRKCGCVQPRCLRPCVQIWWRLVGATAWCACSTRAFHPLLLCQQHLHPARPYSASPLLTRTLTPRNRRNVCAPPLSLRPRSPSPLSTSFAALTHCCLVALRMGACVAATAATATVTAGARRPLLCWLDCGRPWVRAQGRQVLGLAPHPRCCWQRSTRRPRACADDM